jgi:hypothetical protein
MIHFPGLKNLEKPALMVFPALAIGKTASPHKNDPWGEKPI